MAKKSAKPFTPTKGTLVALLLVSMLNCMGGAAVAPALPQISVAFPEASESMVALIISLPSLAVAIAGLFVGMFADAVGKAKTLFASLVLFTVSGLSAIFLPTLEMILVSRFVMGLGMAGVATSSTALIADYYKADEQAKVMGMQSAATGASVLILEMSGGFLALLGWRVPFYVYAIGIVLLVFVALFVREPYHGEEAGEQGEQGEQGERGGRIADRAKGADRKGSKVKGVAAVIAICLTFTFCDMFVAFLVPSKLPYLVDMLGGNTAICGMFLGAYGLANIVSSLAYSRLVRRFGRFTLLAMGFCCVAAGLLALGMADSLWALLPCVVVINLGSGAILPLFANWLAWVTTPQNSGRIMGLFAMMLNLGMFFCPIWAGVVLDMTGGSYSVVYFVAAGMAAVMAACMVVFRAVAPGLQNIHVR